MTNAWLPDVPARLDRAAERRATDAALEADAIVVRDGSVLARDGELVEIPAAHRPATDLVIYLGRDRERDLVALVPSDPAFGTATDGIGGEAMTPLRDLLRTFSARGDAGARDMEVAAAAVAISTWHANHPRCAVCGDVTIPAQGGWVRRCEACDKEHYPRTDPAVIVAITDADDRLLLAHASYWSPRRFSHLAGYVEPGETLEQAVHREVFEEAGLRLTGLGYAGSQPWPFPASVMVAFTATATSPALRLDQEEITEAHWVSRDGLAAQVADGTMVLAPVGSIARRLLEEWFGGPLPERS